MMAAATTDTGDSGAAEWDNAEHCSKDAARTPHPAAPAPMTVSPLALTESTPPMTDDDTYWDVFPDTLTTADVAKILSVGKPAVLTRLKSGVIPGHLVVGSWIIFKAEIRAWLDSNSNQAPPGPPAEVDVLAAYGDEMTYRDLMVLFGKTKQTIYIWLHNGEIPAFHVGNRWIIRKSQLRQKLHETSNQNAPDGNTADTPEQKR